MKKLVFLLGTVVFISGAILLMNKPHAPTPEVSEVSESAAISSAALATTAPAAKVELNSPNKNETPAALSSALKKEIEMTEAALPSIAEVRNSGVDLHETPPQVIRGGEALGDLAEYLKNNPSEWPQATSFYATCAANPALMSAMRAVCYHTLTQHPSDWAAGVKEKISAVSPDIVGISNRL
jgi:hypothetical protein